MNKDLNKILIEKILSNIPDNFTTVDYLMDILELSRDSVYRRLSSKKSFTIEEIIKLSTDLKFSIDDIIKMINNPDHDDNEDQIDMDSHIIQSLDYFINLMKKHITAKDSEIICTMKHLSILYTAKHENIFKFLYFNILHKIRKIPINGTFSEISVPQKISVKLREFVDLFQSVKNISVIIDPNIYLNVIKDIQYFHHRKLITDLNMKELKEELIYVVNTEASIMQKNDLDNNTKYNCYLSLLSFNADTFYSRCDGKEDLFYGPYFVNHLHITNFKSCNLHRKLANSQKRYSILITNTNEDVLVNFISKQHEYIDNINSYSLFHLI